MPFCPKCGRQVTEDAQYCPNCGAPLKPEPTLTPAPPPITGAPISRSIFQRMYRAMMLDVSLYEEVESDQTATSQALLVVITASVSRGIGSAISQALGRATPPRVGTGFFQGLIEALFLWFVWSFITYFVGTRVLGGRATYGELLRTIGFSNSPNILGFFTFIPVLGGILSFALAIWGLVAMIIAVRQALDFSTGQAILTCVVGFIAAIVLLVVAAFILAIPILLFRLL